MVEQMQYTIVLKVLREVFEHNIILYLKLEG